MSDLVDNLTQIKNINKLKREDDIFIKISLIKY